MSNLLYVLRLLSPRGKTVLSRLSDHMRHIEMCDEPQREDYYAALEAACDAMDGILSRRRRERLPIPKVPLTEQMRLDRNMLRRRRRGITW